MDAKETQKILNSLDEDSDDDEFDDESERTAQQLRRKARARDDRYTKGIYWGANQRFFRSLCIASKVDAAIQIARKALEDGNCCVIGLQSTGEAMTNNSMKKNCSSLKGQVANYGLTSASRDNLFNVIMGLIPPPGKPSGVISPNFLKSEINKSTAKEKSKSPTKDLPQDVPPVAHSSRQRRSCRATKKVSYSEVDEDNFHDDEDTDADADAFMSSASSSSCGDNESSSSEVFSLIHWSDIPLEPLTDLSEDEKIRFYRLKNYRLAIEKLKRFHDKICDLNLPSNPLDRLLNELGGPDNVAEVSDGKNYDIPAL